MRTVVNKKNKLIQVMGIQVFHNYLLLYNIHHNLPLSMKNSILLLSCIFGSTVSIHIHILISKDYEKHHTFMHAHIPNPKCMVMAETSTFGIFGGRNVLGRNVQVEMSVAEMSEHLRYMY